LRYRPSAPGRTTAKAVPRGTYEPSEPLDNSDAIATVSSLAGLVSRPAAAQAPQIFELQVSDRPSAVQRARELRLLAVARSESRAANHRNQMTAAPLDDR
jgi:hypothetical protein